MTRTQQIEKKTGPAQWSSAGSVCIFSRPFRVPFGQVHPYKCQRFQPCWRSVPGRLEAGSPGYAADFRSDPSAASRRDPWKRPAGRRQAVNRWKSVSIAAGSSFSRCWTNAEADGVSSLLLKRSIKAFPTLFSLMVSSRDIIVSKRSVPRNMTGVYFMCVFLLKSNFTFQGFAAHFFPFAKPFLCFFQIYFPYAFNLMTLVKGTHRVDLFCEFKLDENGMTSLTINQI